ncbi:hypothetical protein DAI22_11g197201 [Oryza sativa Japonica Group]|nr:hypothetical protein DAI22_11g197201 [Oryza sativa Japonica Group]
MIAWHSASLSSRFLLYLSISRTLFLSNFSASDGFGSPPPPPSLRRSATWGSSLRSRERILSTSFFDSASFPRGTRIASSPSTGTSVPPLRFEPLAAIALSAANCSTQWAAVQGINAIFSPASSAAAAASATTQRLR